MKSFITVAYHQCNIFINHFTYSPPTSSPSPSPSMTITIYHQHHYRHCYHHALCHHSFHSAMNHPLLYAMCPLFVSLCDSVQTHSVIVPAEAVWQPYQLHFDDARACLALHLQLMASTCRGEKWGLWPLKALAHPILHIPPLVKRITSDRIYRWLIPPPPSHFTACNIQFPECRCLTLFSCAMTILIS